MSIEINKKAVAALSGFNFIGDSRIEHDVEISEKRIYCCIEAQDFFTGTYEFPELNSSVIKSKILQKLAYAELNDAYEISVRPNCPGCRGEYYIDIELFLKIK